MSFAFLHWDSLKDRGPQQKCTARPCRGLHAFSSCSTPVTLDCPKPRPRQNLRCTLYGISFQTHILQISVPTQ